MVAGFGIPHEIAMVGNKFASFNRIRPHSLTITDR